MRLHNQWSILNRWKIINQRCLKIQIQLLKISGSIALWSFLIKIPLTKSFQKNQIRKQSNPDYLKTTLFLKNNFLKWLSY